MSNLSEQELTKVSDNYNSITKDFVVHDFDAFHKLIRELNRNFMSDETANINLDNNSLLKGKYMLHKFNWNSIPNSDDEDLNDYVLDEK